MPASVCPGNAKPSRIKGYIDDFILNRPGDGQAASHNCQVEEHEVVDVLDRLGEDRGGRDGSRVALGQTDREGIF